MTGRRLGLGDLVLVMREDEVDAAGVDVERVSQQVDRHRRALEVPTGAPASPRRIPRGSSRLVIRRRGFPEREVLRVLLGVIVLGDSRADSNLALVESGQTTVLGESADREVH